MASSDSRSKLISPNGDKLVTFILEFNDARFSQS